MHGEQRGGGAKFDGEIAVAHGVHGILRDAAVCLWRPQSRAAWRRIRGRAAAWNRQSRRCRAGRRSRAEAIRQPLAIALEHLDVGEQMMREINRLRALQMRVAGNDHVAIFRRRDSTSACCKPRISSINSTRFHRAATSAYRARPGRCASGRCAVSRRRARAASARPRCSCGRLRVPPSNGICRRSISLAMASSAFEIAFSSALVSTPIFWSIVAWADGAEDVVLPKPPVEGNGFGESRHIRRRARWRNVRCGKQEIFYSSVFQNLMSKRVKVTPNRATKKRPRYWSRALVFRLCVVA